MRLIGWGAGLAIAAVAASPALSEDVAACKAIPDAARRLACYDSAATPPSTQTTPNADATATAALAAAITTPPSAWSFDESKSPIDDSLQVAASNQTEEGNGKNAMLIVRCKEHQTDLFIGSTDFWGIFVGDQRVPVLYRVNELPAVEQKWIPGRGGSISSSSAFMPDERNLARILSALPDHGKIFFRVTDYQGVYHDMTFKLDGIDAVRQRVGAACKWSSMANAKASGK
ncbi:type VI secretion system-associated protein TagO [Methylocapsa sp. S129]|uniref:type VI secretion system-associated protein TagO n=1 Tax=Methylocapsa sp. S129 TaxID=1641869 RepID=UPI00131D9AA0|nr:type VI secretion system-associated protein TagO [Methylocapsa sp. S129]